MLFYGSRNCSIIFASVFHNLCFSQARAYLHDQHPAAAAALSDEKLPTDDYHWIASFLHCNYVSMIFFLDQPQPVDSSSYQRFLVNRRPVAGPVLISKAMANIAGASPYGRHIAADLTTTVVRGLNNFNWFV